VSSASNAEEIAAALLHMGARANLRAVTITTHFGLLMQTRVRANASGRPGPRRQTGDYVRTITEETTVTPDGGVSSIVGTNAVQGWRLEAGFAGEDSLGRLYDQPAFPHFEPAYEQTVPEYLEALGALVTL
jgi:hypothetical protein